MTRKVVEEVTLTPLVRQVFGNQAAQEGRSPSHADQDSEDDEDEEGGEDEEEGMRLMLNRRTSTTSLPPPSLSTSC